MTGIASDVIKAKGEDLGTSCCLREDIMRRYAVDSEKELECGCVPHWLAREEIQGLKRFPDIGP